MTAPSELDVDLASADSVADRREEVLAAVREHAGGIAYDLARLDGGDYGQRTFGTADGAWTLKYEAGDLEYLRFDPERGSETYVVSTKSPADPEDLVRALGDYAAFVGAYNDHVASMAGVLDGVDGSFPAVEPSGEVVGERDRIVRRVERCCRTVAGELYRYEGTDYGTFTARIDSTRWELKRELDDVSYLRAGGSGGVYLLSQYGPPAATDVREYVPRFGGFVEAYNDHVLELEADLRTIEV